MEITKETISKWMDLKKELDIIKEQEKQLRISICDFFFKKKKKKIKAFDSILSFTPKFNYNIDQDKLKGIWKDLTFNEKESIKTKYSIIPGKFEKIDKTCLLYNMVTKNKGTPSISITKEQSDVA